MFWVGESVTWVKVQKPIFDLPGVILSALGIAGLCALVALVSGVILGLLLIRRTRSRRARGLEDGPLHLDLARPS